MPPHAAAASPAAPPSAIDADRLWRDRVTSELHCARSWDKDYGWMRDLRQKMDEEKDAAERPAPPPGGGGGGAQRRRSTLPLLTADVVAGLEVAAATSRPGAGRATCILCPVERGAAGFTYSPRHADNGDGNAAGQRPLPRQRARAMPEFLIREREAAGRFTAGGSMSRAAGARARFGMGLRSIGGSSGSPDGRTPPAAAAGRRASGRLHTAPSSHRTHPAGAASSAARSRGTNRQRRCSRGGVSAHTAHTAHTTHTSSHLPPVAAPPGTVPAAPQPGAGAGGSDAQPHVPGYGGVDRASRHLSPPPVPGQAGGCGEAAAACAPASHDVWRLEQEYVRVPDASPHRRRFEDHRSHHRERNRKHVHVLAR